MDSSVAGFSTISCVRRLVGRADLIDSLAGIGHSSCHLRGNDSCIHFAVARSPVDSERATLDNCPPLAPLPLQSRVPVPLRSLWVSKKVQTLELQDSVNSQFKYMEAVPTTDMDAHTEKQSCLECHCSAEDFLESDDVLQQAEGIPFDRELFAKYLRHLQLAELEVAAKLSSLCNLAYMIEEIEPFDMLGEHRLTFITSSLHIKLGANRSPVGTSARDGLHEAAHDNSVRQRGDLRKLAARLTSERVQVLVRMASGFWKIEATESEISSQVHHRDDPATTSISEDIGVSCTEQEAFQSASGVHFRATDVASLTASSSRAAVLSLEGRVEMPAADIMPMRQSCPCEWFICDDQESHTRTFVIQGSESLASWQANLLFEPVQFENPGLNVLVHRGIYEAAKGLYEQLVPHVIEHVHNSHVSSPHVRFTGHSLGGSLATLMTLMLHIREVVPRSHLLPVITFGSPAIMCGGDCLLHKLGLPQNHIQCIVMHRDIVPRSFSCKFPDHVNKFLRAISGTFRNHPCLADKRQLYAPIGQLMILQPDNRQSPNHPFLPGGSGLYVMAPPNLESCCNGALRAAQRAFLNSPHPLQILSDPGAYGTEGTIARDHDPRGYTRAINHVLRREHRLLRRRQREVRRQLWLPLVCKDASPGKVWRPEPPGTIPACGRSRPKIPEIAERQLGLERGKDVSSSLPGQLFNLVKSEVLGSGSDWAYIEARYRQDVYV